MKITVQKVDRAHMVGSKLRRKKCSVLLLSSEITWLWRGMELLI